MKTVFSFLGGVFLTLCAITLFGPWSFYALAVLYAASLFLLFFRPKPTAGLLLLWSLTATVELLGSARFGSGVLLAVIIWLLHQLLGLQLRFTSLWARYIVALLLTLLGYYFLFYPAADFFQRGPGLLALLAVLAAVTLYLATRPNQSHELI